MISHFSHECLMPIHPHRIWFNYHSIISYSEQIIKFLIQQFSPSSCYSLSSVQIFFSEQCSQTFSVYELRFPLFSKVPKLWVTSRHWHYKIRFFAGDHFWLSYVWAVPFHLVMLASRNVGEKQHWLYLAVEPTLCATSVEWLTHVHTQSKAFTTQSYMYHLF
jgi:hypothetical protein